VHRSELQGPDGEQWYDRLNESVPRYISKIIGENVPRVLDITGNRPRGMRRATEDLARRRREELVGQFRKFMASNGSDTDGRVFGRLCMDALLDETAD
jgi:hypothetical protein